MRLIIPTISLIAILFLLTKCNKKDVNITEEYLQIHQEWKNSRYEEVMEEWIPLVSLQWLSDGENNFGSNPENQVVFPDSAPPFIGTLIISEDTLTMKVNPEHDVGLAQFESMDNTILISGGMEMTFENLEWTIIKRIGKYAMRIWDRSQEHMDSIALEYFEAKEEWILDARFEAYPKGSTYPIANVLGMVTDTPILGKLIFNYDGVDYTLDVMKGASETWFVIFGDETNGDETYGAGRYLYVPKVLNGKKTKIDFNKAYNPPCAFTEFATCPLPPVQNHLSLSILAGEKDSYSDNL